jgi:predicted Zn-dependent peptidase
LVYTIHSFVHGYRDSGLFGIYAGSGEAEASELVPAICKEVVGLEDGLTPIELNRAKTQMKAGLLMSLESTSARCEQLAQHLLIHGTPFDPVEIVGHIEAVDDAAIRRVVARWRSAPPTLAAIGPLSGLEEFDRVRDRLAT